MVTLNTNLRHTERPTPPSTSTKLLHSKSAAIELRNKILPLPCSPLNHWCPDFICHAQKCVPKINVIKLQSFSWQLSSVLRQKLWSEHTSLQLHKQIWWWSHGKVLIVCLIPENKMQSIFNTSETQVLAESEWTSKLAYPSDILDYIPELDREILGNNKNTVGNMNKIQGFYSNLKFWLQLTFYGYEMFPTVFSCGAQKDITLVSTNNI